LSVIKLRPSIPGGRGHLEITMRNLNGPSRRLIEIIFLGSLSKPRRRRQRKRQRTKVLMSKTIAVHVRYKLYISLPSTVKQEHEMTKFCMD